MPPNLRELDSRLKRLEDMDLSQVKTDQAIQTSLLQATAKDVQEIKDGIRRVVYLAASTVFVSILGALMALLGLNS